VATDVDGIEIPPSELTDEGRNPGWNVLGEVYQKWQRDIRFVFEPWLELPSSGDFGSLIGRLEAAATELTDEATWQPPVAETGGTASVLSATPELRVFQNLFSRLDDMGGSAIFTFNSNDASRLPGLMSAHGALAQMLLFVARAERAIWEATRVDIVDVADKLVDGVARLDKTITVQEQALQQGLQQALGQAQSDAQAAGYNLRPPSGLLNQTDPDTIVSDELHVSHQNLTWIADTALPHLASSMSQAAHQVGQSQDSGPWYRHVSIGIGASGPLPDFNALSDRLCLLLTNTATEVRQVAQRVRFFSEDVQRTDAEIHDLLVAQTQQINGVG
jgi:hypothetical protein